MDTYGTAYQKARPKAFARSGGTCQFCGHRDATHCHHWAKEYPPADRITPDDLTALCFVCHEMLTLLRRFTCAGGSVFHFLSAMKESTSACGIKSRSGVLLPSSCTTERQDLTPGPLPISKNQRSPASEEATGPRQTTSDSANSNVKSPFGSTRAERLQSRQPPSRAVIETGARKLKQGPQVREGMVVEGIEEFEYDRKLGKTVEELCKTVQFTVGVVVSRARILRTRAKFDEWAVSFIVDVDDELVDKAQLSTWLDIGGRRIGLGDWRPEKSGHFGRFEMASIKKL